jgi:hypothetical protein
VELFSRQISRYHTARAHKRNPAQVTPDFGTVSAIPASPLRTLISRSFPTSEGSSWSSRSISPERPGYPRTILCPNQQCLSLRREPFLLNGVSFGHLSYALVPADGEGKMSHHAWVKRPLYYSDISHHPPGLVRISQRFPFLFRARRN